MVLPCFELDSEKVNIIVDGETLFNFLNKNFNLIDIYNFLNDLKLFFTDFSKKQRINIDKIVIFFSESIYKKNIDRELLKKILKELNIDLLINDNIIEYISSSKDKFVLFTSKKDYINLPLNNILYYLYVSNDKENEAKNEKKVIFLKDYIYIYPFLSSLFNLKGKEDFHKFEDEEFLEYEDIIINILKTNNPDMLEATEKLLLNKFFQRISLEKLKEFFEDNDINLFGFEINNAVNILKTLGIASIYSLWKLYNLVESPYIKGKIRDSILDILEKENINPFNVYLNESANFTSLEALKIFLKYQKEYSLKKIEFEELDKITKEKQILKEEIDKLRNKIKYLKMLMIDKEITEENRLKLENELKNLELAYKNLEEAIEKLKHNIKNLTKRVEDLQNKKTFYLNELENKKNIVLSLEIEVNNLEKSLKEKEKILEELKNKKDNLEKTLENLKKDINYILNLEKEIKKLKEELNKKSIEKEKLENEKVNLKILLEKIEKEVKNLKKEVTLLSNKKQDLKKELEKYQKEIDEFYNLKENVKELEKEYLEVKEEKSSLLNKMEELIRKKEELEIELENIKKEKAKFEKIINEISMKIALLRGELDALQEKYNNLKEKEKEYTYRKQKLEKEITNLENKGKQIIKEIKKLSEEKEKKEKFLEDLLRTLNEYKRIMDFINKKEIKKILEDMEKRLIDILQKLIK